MEQNVLQTLAAIAQQAQGNPEEALGQMVEYLVGEGMDEESAAEIAARVLEQISGSAPVSGADTEEGEEVVSEKCGGTVKKVKKHSFGAHMEKKSMQPSGKVSDLNRPKNENTPIASTKAINVSNLFNAYGSNKPFNKNKKRALDKSRILQDKKNTLISK